MSQARKGRFWELLADAEKYNDNPFHTTPPHLTRGGGFRSESSPKGLVPAKSMHMSPKEFADLFPSMIKDDSAKKPHVVTPETYSTLGTFTTTTTMMPSPKPLTEEEWEAVAKRLEEDAVKTKHGFFTKMIAQPARGEPLLKPAADATGGQKKVSKDVPTETAEAGTW